MPGQKDNTGRNLRMCVTNSYRLTQEKAAIATFNEWEIIHINNKYLFLENKVFAEVKISKTYVSFYIDLTIFLGIFISV